MSGRRLPPAICQRVSPLSIKWFRYIAWCARWNEPRPRWRMTSASICCCPSVCCCEPLPALVENMERGKLGLDPDLVAGRQRAARVLPHDDLHAARRTHIDQRLGPERLDEFDLRRNAPAAGRGHVEVFGAHAERTTARHLAAERARELRHGIGRKHVHLRRADELRNEL